ncbi:hypothetical protein B0H34DRAFT_654936 [Crassisporium funariophilum]|nr:hypothetical protein B0H34DRAFT_654936 [Crassisporium funariophilum]
MPVNCSICLSIFKEPVSLPCGHIYCTKCLADHVNAPNNQGMTSTCPTCRTGFSIVTPDLTYLPKKYHQYIVPSVRRVYLDASQDTALQEKLKQAEARLKLQKKNEEDLLKRCEGLKAAVHAHQTGETKANQKVRQLEANLVTVEDELYEDIRSLHARVEELEEENYKTQIKLDNLRARHKAMEDK